MGGAQRPGTVGRGADVEPLFAKPTGHDVAKTVIVVDDENTMRGGHIRIIDQAG